jgi:threonine dehydratase
MSVQTFETTLEYVSPEAREFLETYQKPTVDDLLERVEVMSEAEIGTPPIESYRVTDDSKVEILNLRTDEAPGKSFKARGAWYAVRKAYQAGYRRVVTASAGNHGQGLAHAVEVINLQHPEDQMTSVINMANSTPEVKKNGIRRLGKESVTLQDSFADFETAKAYAETEGEINTDTKFVSPYNDYDVIAGQGTSVLEALLEHPDVDEIHVAVGGGGVLAGILENVVALKEAGHLNPDTKVIAMIPEGTNDGFINTWKNNWKPTPATKVDTFTEGSAVHTPGDIPIALASLNYEHLEIEVVPKQDLARELAMIETRNFERARDGLPVNSIPETTTLTILAGTSNRALLYDLDPENTKPRKFLTLTTGSNADPQKLSTLHEMAEQIPTLEEKKKMMMPMLARRSFVLGGLVGAR